MGLLRFLQPPIYESEEDTRISRALFNIQFALLLMTLLALPIVILIRLYDAGFGLGCGLVVLLFAIYLNHYLHLRSSCLLTVLLVLGSENYVSWHGQGIHDIVTLVYPLVLIIAGVLLSRRLYFFILGLTIFSADFIIFAEIRGWIQTDLGLLTNYPDMLIVPIVLVTIGITIRLLADNLVVSLANTRQIAEQQARLILETHDQADQLRTLNELGIAVASGLDLEQVLVELYEQLKKVVPMDSFYVALVNTEANQLSFPFFISLGERVDVPRRTLDAGLGLTGEVIHTQRTLNLPDCDDPDTARQHQILNVGPGDTRSYLGIPLHLHGKVLGVLSVQCIEPYTYNERQIRLLETIASQASVAIDNAQLFVEVKDALRREERLNQIAHAISGTLDLQFILENVVRLSVELIGADAGTLSLTSADQKKLDDIYDFNIPASLSGANLKKGRGITWEIIETRQPVCLVNYADHPKALKDLVEAGFHGYAGVPVLAGEQVLGSLGLLSLDPLRRFSERDLALLVAIGRLAGAAIQNARLYATLQDELVERGRVQQALHRHDAVLEAMTYAAEKFLAVPDWELNIPLVLERLGRATKVSHAYLIEVNRKIKEPEFSIRFAYNAPDAPTEIHTSTHADIPLEKIGMSLWYEKLASGEPYSGTLDSPNTYSASPEEKKFFHKRSIRSLLSVPIFVDQMLWGAFSFDDSKVAREWSDAEVDALKVAAGILSAAIQRQRADEALRASEVLYRRAITAADAVPYFRDHLQNCYTFMGEGIERLTGYSAEEMSPDLWDQLIEQTIPIGDAAGIPFSEATIKARLGQIPIWRCDYLIRTAGGSSRWIADTALEQMGPDGKSRGSIGILQDITDRKLAETALKESEQRFRAILDTVPDIIAEVDINKVFTWVNQAGRQFFGDPVIGSSAVSYFEAERNFYERVQPLFDGESDDFYLETWHSRQDGEKRLLAWWGRSIVDTVGIITGALFSARDITENKLAEAAVRQAEEKYRTIFENTLVGTYWSTPQGRYIIVNPAYAKILGYESPELLMQEIQDIGAQLYVEPTERAKLLELLDRDGELNGYETRIFRKDGKVVDVRFDDSVVRDPDGRILYYQGTVLDITDRKQAESALQESEQRFRAIFENSATSIALSDSDWMILTANPSFQDLFGYAIDELQHMHMGQLSHPDDLPEEEENVRRMIAGEIDSFQLEKRYLRKDSSIFWGRTTGSFIRDETGAPRYGLMLVNDITDQKRAIEGLRERDAILQSVAFEAEAFMKAADWRDSIDVFLEMLGKETGSSHVYVYRTHINQDGQMYFTMDHEWTAPDEISDLDNPFFLAVPLEHVGGKYWLAAVLNGEPYYGSLSSMPPEEIEVLKFYDLKATLDVPINVGDSFWGFIGFDDVKNDRDWSEAEVDSLKAAAGILSAAIQRQMNDEAIRQLNAELEQRVRLRTSELENANRELESFAYSVSHDLRTPLRGIDGYSRLLLEDFGSLLDQQGREYLENVRKATSQMGQLIDDLLKLSRVTRLEMHNELFDLSGKANELVAELHHQHPDRNVQITVQPGLIAFGDSNLLRLVLENLLSNAWKFTSQNQKAKIKIGKTFQDGQTVFYIRDNGVGFDMKYSHKLFVAFQRLHSVDDFEGTGVGLATVYRIIQRHSGRIWADAKVGRGATFYFMLPGPEEGSD